jgi:hypothetical protein
MKISAMDRSHWGEAMAATATPKKAKPDLAERIFARLFSRLNCLAVPVVYPKPNIRPNHHGNYLATAGLDALILAAIREEIAKKGKR